MKLTNIQVKNAKPIEKMYRLGDGGNLSLEVHPNGSKYWRIGNQMYKKMLKFG